MTSSAIFLALQAGSLTLHTFSSSRRSCLITCSSFSLLRNAAPHLLPLNEAISNRVGDLIKPRGGSYSFQSTPCWATGRPLIKSPTLFEIASFNGSKWGAAFLNKEKLLHVIKQDRRLLLNVCSVNEPACTAKKIAEDVIASYKTSTEGKPALFVVQLADIDTAGHGQGWMSKPYLKAVEDVDRGIGSLTKGFKELGLFDRTTFIVTSDHGGHAKTHGTSMAEDMTIPWIAAGPGIKAGDAIKQPASRIGTAAPVMRAFGITDYYVEL